MNTCPNINLPEWKALEKAVGRFEAYRDYMETNGQIRDPKTVIEKIDLRNRYGRADDAGELSKIKEAVANDVDWATTTLEAKTEEFLAGLGFKVEYEENLYETVGYNIVAATDLIQKTVHLHESLGKQAFTKEAAYALLEMLGRKNILYKELIHNVHLLEDYQTRVAPYTNSDLNDWMQRKLVVVDYLFEQLNKNFESFETIDKKRISKDITAGNKFQYAMLRFKLWIKNLFKKFRVKQNRQKFTDIINQVAQSVLTRNYDLWSVGKRTMKKFDPDVYLQKDPALKDAFTKLRDMGFIPSGSYALAKQGTVYRDSFNDLDFTVPFDQVESGEYLKKLKKAFPNMTIGKIFKGVNKYAVTLPLRLGDVKVDLFLPLSKEYPYSITPEGVQNWESIFDAKIRIGSKKHMADLVNFIPSTSNAVMLQGMRHYNFDFVPSRYSDIYNTGQIFSPHGNVVSLSNADVEFLYPIARDYLQHNKRIDKNGVVVCANGKPSQQFAALMGYHNDEKRAMIDYWKTFSQDFLSWYGMVPDRKNVTSLKFVQKKYEMSTPSIYIDTNGEPMVQYHGAGSVFDTFDKHFFRQGEGVMAFGAGFYGTNFKPTADQYRDTANAAMKKFQELVNKQDAELLKIMKKLEIDLADLDVVMLTNMIASGGRKGFGDLLSLLGITETKFIYVKLTNPLEWNDKVRPHIREIISRELKVPKDHEIFNGTEGALYYHLQTFFSTDEEAISAILYDIGIDGTVHYTGGGFAAGGFQHKKGERHFVIFEPVQAKAINNRGFFSSLNANMYDTYGALPSNKFVRDEFLVTGKKDFNASVYVSPEKQAKRDALVEMGAENLKSSLEEAKENKKREAQRQKEFDKEFDKNMRRYEQEKKQFVSKLSKALGIEYEFISATEAREMTKNADNPWSHELAFFFNGKVYFVGDSLSKDSAFHEFSHPFVRAIIKENPDLARQLFNELVDTDLGKRLVQNYIHETAFDYFAELDEFNDLKEGRFDNVPLGFVEEVLVRALTSEAMDYIYGMEPTPQFKNVVEKLMHHIKQLLRKIFGKSIKISKLDVNTSLGELVDIIKEGRKVDISLDLVTDTEEVAYYSEDLKDPYTQLGYDIRTTVEAWKNDPTRTNKATWIHLKGTPIEEEFQLKKDEEAGFYSVHFKTTQGILNEEQKAKLVAAAASLIPMGGKLSTWGNITKGGIAGLNRFLNNGFVKIGDRTIMDRTDNPVTIPILQKVKATSLEHQVAEMRGAVTKELTPEEVLRKLETRKVGTTDRVKQVKPGVTELFESNPELASIGTPGQYSAYLDTIFSDSKVKDIVYHGTNETFEEFLEDSLNYFGTKEIAKEYGKKLYPAVIEIRNPYYEDGGNLSNQSYEDLYYKLDESNADGFISLNKVLFVPKTAEQIHILGSKQDIEGFKEFVSTTGSAPFVAYRKEDPSLQDLKNVVEPQVAVIDTAAIEQDYALELADKMSRMLGVDYEMISAKEAQELTKDAQNPWNGQFAFFYGGKVYFVKDGFTKAHVFHEFCHPVIRSLAKTDPELFAKLYNEALNTSEGRAIFQLVADRYGLEPNSDLFKEEVIVQMLEQMGMKILDKEVPSPAFKNIIDKIMYEIKQLLRRVFGKNIPVSKITPRTSLKELAEILVKGEKLEIDTELITDEDIVAYRMDEEQQYREIQEDLGNVRNKDIQDTINSLYDQVDQHINMLLRDGYYEELAELLMDENQRGDLQQIKSNLRAWQTRIRETAEDFLKEAADSKNRVNALTNTLFRVEVVMRKIHDHVKDLSTRPETQEVVGQIYYYNKMLDHWKKFITDLKEMLNEEENKVPPRSAVMSLVNDIDSYIDRSKDVLDKMYRKAGVDTLWDTLTPIAGNLQDDFDAMIAKLDKLKAPQREYDRRYKDYYGMVKTEWDRYRVLLKKEKANTLTRAEEEEIKILHAKAREGLYIDKAKIEATVKGQMGDANFFSSYLEGYLYNPDPIVGGLALFIKNAMSDVMIVTQRKYNIFAADMENLLKDYGGFANSLREGWLGERTLFKDTIGVLKDGRYVPMEVLTFLNGYKGHRWAKAEQNQTLEDAYAAWDENRTDATRAAYLEALEKHREFMSDYFYQEYDDRYYEKDKVFKKFNGDQIGRDAYEARTEIFEKMRLLLEGNKTQMDELETSKQMELYWREYRQLFSRYNLDGSLKKDNAAAIAERLREYREKSKELYENRIRKGVFENAYFDFLQELRDKNIQEHSSEWDYEIERWKKNNLRAAIKPEFFEYRNSRIAKIEAILKKLDPSIRKDNDTAAIWTKILELTTVRDNDNQTIGTELSEGSIAEVKKLQEQLAKLKADTTPLTNLTKTENARMRELNNQRWTVGITTAELEELKALQAKRAQGLSDVDIALLSGYYQELASMQIKQATVYYVDTLNDWLSRLDTSNIKRLLGGDGLVDQDTADMLADDLSALNDLFSQSPDFEKWWKDNHMLSKKKVEVSEGQWVEVNYYERVYVWNVIRPKNPDMMETHTIKDSYGNEIVFEGLPTMKYYARVVKPKYKTPRIVGVTVDNQGNFLPKSKEDMDKATHLSEGDRYKFIDMEYHRLKNSNAVEDKKLFAILEKLKQHHLANQEGLPRSSKLYYDAPRFMKSNLEAAQSFSLKRKDKDGKQVNMLTYLMQRIREFWHGNAEDKYQGLRNMEAGLNIIRVDMFDNELTNVPIAGIYSMDVDAVARNITMSMMRYMQSAERQKQLIKISPIARAIQASIANPEEAVNTLKTIDARNRKTRKIVKMVTKGDSVRKKAVDNLIAREFAGETQAGFTKNMTTLNKVANLLFKRASFSFFAINIPSALKNSLGMKFQEMIETSGGEYVDHISLQRGNLWAGKVVGELTFTGEAYTRGMKNHDVQLTEAFDMAQDRFAEVGRFGGQMSRTLLRDIAEGQHWFGFRKMVEYQATLQLSGGMLYKKRLKRVMPDGTVQELPYIEAFETVDGLLRLKDGIDVRYGLAPIKHIVSGTDTVESIMKQYHIQLSEDPERQKDEQEAIFRSVDLESIRAKVEELEYMRDDELETTQQQIDTAKDPEDVVRLKDRYNAISDRYAKKIAEAGTITIDNTEFKLMKNRMHQVTNNMGGAYAKFDQPEAQRYLAFRFIAYMRRYFTGMAIARWGASGQIWRPRARRNFGIGGSHMGFYTDAIATTVQAIRTAGNSLKYLSPREKANVKRFITEFLMLKLTVLLMAWLFGWDPEDEDRYEKLRARSGPALQGLGVTKGEEDFDLLGFGELHALHMLMQVRAENEQFNPIMGGFDDYFKLVDLKSVVFGPTTDSFLTLVTDSKQWVTGDPKAYYTRDMGPYTWQEKGDLKFYNHLLKMVGLTGRTVDPAMAIQNLQNFMAKVRR